MVLSTTVLADSKRGTTDQPPVAQMLSIHLTAHLSVNSSIVVVSLEGESVAALAPPLPISRCTSALSDSRNLSNSSSKRLAKVSQSLFSALALKEVEPFPIMDEVTPVTVMEETFQMTKAPTTKRSKGLAGRLKSRTLG